MLKNQIKVLLQRVCISGRTPRSIVLSRPLRDSLRLEMATALLDYKVGDEEDTFFGVPVRLVRGTTEPLIELEPVTNG